MRVLTTTLCYPTGRRPDQGIFVQRRCLALAQRPGVCLRVIAPQPWCPLLRPDGRTGFGARPDGPGEPGGPVRAGRSGGPGGPLRVEYPPMLSVPMLGWATDGLAFAAAPRFLGALHPMPAPPELGPLAANLLDSRKLSIYGGSNEVQRNLVAQALLKA